MGLASDCPATVPGGTTAVPAAAPGLGALESSGIGPGAGAIEKAGPHMPVYAVWQSWGPIPRSSARPVGSEDFGVSGPSSSEASIHLTSDLTQEKAFNLANGIWWTCETKHGYKIVDRDYTPYFYHNCSTLEALFELLKMKYHPSKPRLLRSTRGTTTGSTALPDDKFMPFGPLSKDILQRALDILKELERKLSTATPSATALSDKSLAKLVKLQSEYHTLIPQSLDIGLQGKLAADTHMIAVGSHIQKVTRLLGTNAHASSSGAGPAVQNSKYSCNCPKGLNKLLLRTLEALPVDGDEYSEIAAYFYNTLYWMQGRVTIVHIFRIDRQGEAERWAKVMRKKLGRVHDNRKMLWHGSTIGNFQSILRSGLKIVGMSEIYFSEAAIKR